MKSPGKLRVQGLDMTAVPAQAEKFTFPLSFCSLFLPTTIWTVHTFFIQFIDSSAHLSQRNSPNNVLPVIWGILYPSQVDTKN